MKVSKPYDVVVVDAKTGLRSLVPANQPFEMPDDEAQARMSSGEDLTAVAVDQRGKRAPKEES